MDITKVKIIDNNSEKSKNARKIVEENMKKYGIEESLTDPDLVIAIGGDGAFIHALKNTMFSTKCLYVGIYTGRLGFLPEVKVEEIEALFEILKTKDYKVETLNFEEIELVGEDVQKYYALNEMVLRESNLKVIQFDILVNGNYFKSFAGDGVIVSTSTGSTAHSLSAGGSIIFPSLKTLQILPLAPLPLSNEFSSLRNSVVVPENMTVTLVPKPEYTDKIRLMIDGEAMVFDHIKKINITTAKEGIGVLRFKRYDFFARVNEKFL